MENPINYWYQKYLSLKAEMDKMKAGAVEGEIMGDIGSQEDEPHEVYVESMPLPLDRNWKIGDKVHIIVLPKED